MTLKRPCIAAVCLAAYSLFGSTPVDSADRVSESGYVLYADTRLDACAPKSVGGGPEEDQTYSGGDCDGAPRGC